MNTNRYKSVHFVLDKAGYMCYTVYMKIYSEELVKIHEGSWYMEEAMYDAWRAEMGFLELIGTSDRFVPVGGIKVIRIDPMSEKRAILLGYIHYKPGIFYKP